MSPRFFNWFLKKKRKILLDQNSSYHDLKTIYNWVNTVYFEGKIDLPITWFGSREKRVRTRFRFGSYNSRTQIVKVHRMLDHPNVPQYCVAFILYHEILHHVLPPIKISRGKRKIHHRAFVLKEKEFQEYSLAKEFLKSLVYGRA